MNDSSGHPFIRLSNDVEDLFWHFVVSQKSPEGLPVNIVKRLLILDEDDIQGQIPGIVTE
ncbi:hypothetical protein DPMN_098081 [Dreissena polymorpha]|uniref:Uncharacterized protein n=1 Tax=Dreissena polymorpha TaxID=45954 RepID=A0A9D4R6X6_DREPO|nr:hypothetical protein DPMN_098063 [Dreissena polymorpha]KAH3855513.1 hypothetical protein DPMN_098081 [Dreissena polymorpha]